MKTINIFLLTSLCILSTFIFLHPFFPHLFFLPSYSLPPNILTDICYQHAVFSVSIAWSCSFPKFVLHDPVASLPYIKHSVSQSLSSYLPRSSFENDLTSNCHWKMCGYFCWSTSWSPTASNTSTSIFEGSALHRCMIARTEKERKKGEWIEILLTIL